MTITWAGEEQGLRKWRRETKIMIVMLVEQEELGLLWGTGVLTVTQG